MFRQARYFDDTEIVVMHTIVAVTLVAVVVNCIVSSCRSVAINQPPKTALRLANSKSIQ
ncbi:Hypothetical protein CINCED_3A012232 [Cinara cedri]|uniref:Uncharacterized protein n=1 Tax=Cinara cedri TaxID=506608 RepID=A0A5E4N261_9HEMI|nr:Hypothetical protein CINCED_3A012232 [Cinara cedri]